MDSREEIVKTCIPISMTRRLDPTLTECLIVLEGPPAWHQDELTHTKALDSAFHIKNRLQELLEASYALILPMEAGDEAITIYVHLKEALELL